MGSGVGAVGFGKTDLRAGMDEGGSWIEGGPFRQKGLDWGEGRSVSAKRTYCNRVFLQAPRIPSAGSGCFALDVPPHVVYYLYR